MSSILSFEAYKDKIKGCWDGKNIGGTLGAPFECLRGVFEIDGYSQELGGEPLPNDDLDLQLVWLNAVEAYGDRINSKVLGEYWHWFVTPHWAEYGAGKNNMRAGMLPPLSGGHHNLFKDSCGAFILSELWACLAPGHPELAARYAFEDATVNHADEGLYAEVFCAAVESAAFVESDVDLLVDIGLSYIPKDCGVARGIQCVRRAYREGVDWKEARRRLLVEVPGSFGAMGTRREDMDPDIPVGSTGYDAPSNVGIILIGWLYGEGDFGKSLCIAAGCGEDADCTAGTLGAILGIVMGARAIPTEWLEPLGGKIKTKCINIADVGLKIPSTVAELTERVLRLTPVFLGSEYCDVLSGPGYTIAVQDAEAMFCREYGKNAFFHTNFFEEVLARSPYIIKEEFVLFDAFLDYKGDPYIRAGEGRTLRIIIENRFQMQQWIRIKWHLPEGWRISPAPEVSGSLESYYCNLGRLEQEFTLTADTLDRDHFEPVVEISSVGHHSKGFLPVILFAR